jgi:hypothetical protein
MDPATIVRVIRIVTGKPCRENIAPDVAAQDEHVGPDRGRQVRPERLRMSCRASSPGVAKDTNKNPAISRSPSCMARRGQGLGRVGHRRYQGLEAWVPARMRPEKLDNFRRRPRRAAAFGAERSFTETPTAAKCRQTRTCEKQPCFDIAETVRLQPPDREQLRPK